MTTFLLLAALLFVSAPPVPSPMHDCLGMTLDCTDPMVGGQPVTLDITGVANGASAPVLLFVSSEINPIPFYSCTLYPDIGSALEILLFADAAGEVHITTTFPTGVPTGIPFHMQAIAEDNPPAAGYQTSNPIAPQTG